VTYASRRTRATAAFTLLELLITIGVIIVLLGMLMFGLRAFSNSSKARETRATLEIAMGLFSELDAKIRLAQNNDVKQYWASDQGNLVFVDLESGPYSNPAWELSFWNDPTRTMHQGPPNSKPAPIRAPGKVASGEADRDRHEAIWNTAIAMSRFMALPTNRSKVQSMPSQRVLLLLKDATQDPTGQAPTQTTSGVTAQKFPILLDAWGNPIIFVPASGLGSDASGAIGALKVGGVQRVVTSSKLRDPINVNTDYAILGTDRPFFASAGPDGDFTTGDDNIYSFEK
jgi:type II secretory pathway pseudopilin PulG